MLLLTGWGTPSRMGETMSRSDTWLNCHSNSTCFMCGLFQKNKKRETRVCKYYNKLQRKAPYCKFTYTGPLGYNIFQNTVTSYFKPRDFAG